MRVTAETVARMPAAERRAWLGSLSPDEATALQYRWNFWARDKQLTPPGNWSVWLVKSGRGFGKTRVGAEWVRERVESGKYRRIAFIGETAADVRDTMIDGESGILNISPPSFRPKHEASKRRLTWPNGAYATLFSGDAPQQLRGPNHDTAWVDELAKFKYPELTWDNLEFGLRLGENPQSLVTTTPRPMPIIKKLMADPQTIITNGHTDENRGNLSARFMERVIRRYEGTRIGRQELAGEILDDNPLALWKRDQIEKLRHLGKVPDLSRIVVAIDPQVADPDATEDEQLLLAETGIVVAGMTTAGTDPHYYVLDDVSISDSPNMWAGAAVDAYIKWMADRIVAETNQGGAMVEFTVRTVARDRGISVPYEGVHASRGKYTRAEPVAALYEQKRVHHCGCFPVLEDQMCEWMPGSKSPDRMDALVWALSYLALAENSLALDPEFQRWMISRAQGN